MMLSIMSRTIEEAKKGTAELVALALIAHEPMHGYELARRIAERSNGSLTFNFASLYATLYKLEERGLIQGRWVERAGQRRRRHYRITTKGREALGVQRRTWQEFFHVLRDLTGIAHA